MKKPMKMKKAPAKMAKKSPAKNVGLKKLAEANPNLEYKAAAGKMKKSAMAMKKAAMKLKKESAMKLKKSGVMMKKAAVMMKKAAGMKMKKK